MSTDIAIPDSLSLLSDLIAQPTISADSNLDLMHYVRDFLASHGISSELVLSEDGRKANLFAIVGPRDVPGVMLSGHTDVVPVKGQPWTADPFELRVIDGKAIGRGAVDMKGFIACALRCAALAAHRPLRQPIVLALSHDEEIGCVGVRRLLPRLAQLPAKPLLCVVGEPTSMAVVTAHKGKVMGSIECTGTDGHSSDPDQGINAIFLAAEMIAAARELQIELKAPDQVQPAFTVPHSTLHIGVIQGGAAVNMIPRACTVKFELRTLPGVDQQALVEALRVHAQRIAGQHRKPGLDAAITVTVNNAYPPLSTPDDDPGVYFAQRLCGRFSAGKVAYGTEAGLFQSQLGIPSVVCGPGSVAQAHQPDEFVLLSQLDECDSFLARLVDQLVEGVALEPLTV